MVPHVVGNVLVCIAALAGAVLTARGTAQSLPFTRAAADPAAISAAKSFATPDNGNVTLTAVEGVKVGHYTMPGRPTGCTVVLVKDGTIGSVDQRGGAPATRETDLLDPVNSVQHVNAITLSGGSAYGLDAATGVVRWLEEHDIGFRVPSGVVPIVPAASLIDLAFGGDPNIRPTAECGYRAAAAASIDPVTEGNVGAGAGATVGKLLRAPDARPMKAGIGSYAIRLEIGLVVAAIAAVNAIGDVVDPATGQVVAGVRTVENTLADARKLLRAGRISEPRVVENTTLGVVATNATITKVHAAKVAQMAHDGLARAIAPTHTPGDGDTIFALATGTWTGDTPPGTIGALAAEAMAEAIVRAAVRAEASGGLPSARDLRTIPKRFR